MKHASYTVGQWYLLQDTQERFQVIDTDELSRAIRIQLFDGSLDEIELDAWHALSPLPVEPPKDWTGVLDLEVAELDEWADEAEDSLEIFRDDREPWEDIVLEEETAMDAEHAPTEWEASDWRSMRPLPQRDETGGTKRLHGL